MNPLSADNPVSCAPPCVVLSTAAESRSNLGKDSELSRWFGQEIQAHEHELRAYLRRRFPSLGDVDDLLQDTYARILRAHEVGKASLTRAYLFVTARNAALDQLRRKRPISLEQIAEFDPSAVVEERPDAAESVSRDQELEILAEAVASLPTRCREIFILRRYHGLSHKQIAQKLALAENTVNAQLVSGMLRCREYLRARGVTHERNHARPRS